MQTSLETPTITSETKWDGSTLGPRQAKQINDAFSKFNLAAQTQTELTDHGPYNFTALAGSYRHPLYAGLLLDIKIAYEAKITPANYQDIIRDIADACKKLDETRPVVDKRSTPEQLAERDLQRAENAKREEERKAAEEVGKVAWNAILAKKPAGNVCAVIVAELKIDDSDSMTDYYASHTGRCVAIGWRTGTREDFRQLRAAASTFEPTSHLGTGCDRWRLSVKRHPDAQYGGGTGIDFRDAEGNTVYAYTEAKARELAEAMLAKMRTNEFGGSALDYGILTYGYELSSESVEHRENYSMGAGNYLGCSRNSGWQVKSYGLDYAPSKIEDGLPAESTERPARQRVGAVSGVVVSENTEKSGLEIRFPGKPDGSILERLKANGWRWSRFSACWYCKNPTARDRALAAELAGSKFEVEDEGLRAMTDVDAQMGA